MDIRGFIEAKKAAYKARNTPEALMAEKKKLMAADKERTQKQELKKEIRALKTKRTREGVSKLKKGIKSFQDNSKKNNLFGSGTSGGVFAPSGNSPFAVTEKKPMKKKEGGQTITIKIQK